MFGMCSIFLFVASVLQRRLSAIGDKPSEWFVAMEYNIYMVSHTFIGLLMLHTSRDKIYLASWKSVTRYVWKIFCIHMMYLLPFLCSIFVRNRRLGYDERDEPRGWATKCCLIDLFQVNHLYFDIKWMCTSSLRSGADDWIYCIIKKVS